MITLKYRINGALFRLRYERQHYRDAAIRAQVLRENGIHVAVRGFPKRIEVRP